MGKGKVPTKSILRKQQQPLREEPKKLLSVMMTMKIVKKTSILPQHVGFSLPVRNPWIQVPDRQMVASRSVQNAKRISQL